ncbi:MAG TPA: stage II sporulation protein M, partial [Thermoanaerobaculia bacterium]|nr:stage II sporulation protein M [Thermoanaerobaculia bacterium]
LSLVRFFFTRFPAAVRASLPWIGVATALFFVTGLLGVAVAVYEPGVATAILGPAAIHGLRDGHLWTESLTTTVPPSFSSSAIATNNMSVALTAWAGGALFGLGSVWVAMFNGFLLGAVFGVTARFSMAAELGEFVVAHGPLEITLILVCAGAGLGIGVALLRADDLPRSITVPRAAREALVVLLGCLPWFLLLGIVEGFLSPSPALPVLWKGLLGFALEVCFLAPIALGALKEGAT